MSSLIKSGISIKNRKWFKIDIVAKLNVFCLLLEPLYVAVEFVSGGSLDKLLRESRVRRYTEQEQLPYANIWSRLTERELLRIASDIANGMQHLESKLASHTLIY